MTVWTLIKNAKTGNPVLKSLPVKERHGRRLRRQRRANFIAA